MFKKVLTTTVFGVSALGAMIAHAAAPGVYVTGQVGYANNNMHLATEDRIDNNNLSESSLGGRVAIGYQFNQNFALETGYFHSMKKHVTLVGKDKAETLISDNLGLRQHAIDLVAKSIFPVNTNLNLYGKLGVAYLTTDFDKDTFNGRPISNMIAKHKLAPEAAIGVSYDITPNVSIDSSWTHIQPIGKNRPGNIDFVALGLGYNFG
ncbi:outer membrane beta-barrel protein [Rickettsiella grylli]|uniref:Outer membrane protein OmpA-like transmembrane domain-containing protein n=1 Tax=Rickettsiella grylli TaxID=59196 RepID=A8PML7_9COXI|nr:outer membrane beta-barrel protein [Rickettsiella grylli]EDP45886.1 hypothetical protein RICGR_0764 [Rickettsiella grylli]